MWREIGTLDDRGDVGGDLQAGRAYSRRFARQLDGGEFAVIDIHYVAARDDEFTAGARLNEFWVHLDVEYLLCTDPSRPGDTEMWSNGYGYGGDRRQHVFRAAGEAERRAKRLAQAIRPRDITWNGDPRTAGGGI